MFLQNASFIVSELILATFSAPLKYLKNYSKWTPPAPLVQTFTVHLSMKYNPFIDI